MRYNNHLDKSNITNIDFISLYRFQTVGTVTDEASDPEVNLPRFLEYRMTRTY